MTMTFSGQRKDEQVVFVFRRHFLALRKGLYGIAIPFAIGSIPFLVMPDVLWLFWVAMGSLGLGLLVFFYHWIGWFYSIFIVTNQRIQQTSQKGLFGKSVIDLDLAKIQNISFNIPGFWGEAFNFGTIVIQTYVGDMVIDKVEHPERTFNQLQDAVEHAVARGGQAPDDEEASQEAAAEAQ